MGRRGPAPKPATLRLLQGARPGEVNQNEPIPRKGKMEPPPGLPEDAVAVFEWAAEELAHMRIDSPADRDSLAAYACAVVNHRDASAKVAEFGILVKGKGNRPVRNPALIVQRDAAQQIRAFAQEFGLTPSARARIDSQRDDGDVDNPFAAAP